MAGQKAEAELAEMPRTNARAPLSEPKSQFSIASVIRTFRISHEKNLFNIPSTNPAVHGHITEYVEEEEPSFLCQANDHTHILISQEFQNSRRPPYSRLFGTY